MKKELFESFIYDIQNIGFIHSDQPYISDSELRSEVVSDYIGSFCCVAKPSYPQIAEYIEELAFYVCGDMNIKDARSQFMDICNTILDNDSSDEAIATLLKTFSNQRYFYKKYYSDEVSNILIRIIDEHPKRVEQIRTFAQKNGFDGVFGHKIFSEPKMLQMLEVLNTAQKNNDKKALLKFQAKLAKMSDHAIYQIDHAAMEWLVNNFTQENFDKVNNLRACWGLKVVISEQGLTEKNLRDIRRMDFSHNVAETDHENPHFQHTYSDAYKEYVANRNKYITNEPRHSLREYKASLAANPAVEQLKEHGYATFVKQLPQALKDVSVPLSLVSQLCVKDLQHFLIEYHSRRIRDRDQRSIFDFDEVDIQHKAGDVRKTFWQEVVKDKDLVKFISKDLKKKGIDQETIKKIWDRAEEYGNPNEWVNGDKVRDVFFNVHHRVALKDGGTNTPDNFVIVIRMPGVVDSHSPLHEYDNPLIHLYKRQNVGEDGVIISDHPTSEEDKEIRLNTVFVADEENIRKNINKRVLYYGGPHQSMYVGKVHKAVRTALDTIEYTHKKIERAYKKMKENQKQNPENKKRKKKKKKMPELEENKLPKNGRRLRRKYMEVYGREII